MRDTLLSNEEPSLRSEFEKAKTEYDNLIQNKELILKHYNLQYTKNNNKILEIKKKNKKFNLIQFELKKLINMNMHHKNYFEIEKNIKDYRIQF